MAEPTTPVRADRVERHSSSRTRRQSRRWSAHCHPRGRGRNLPRRATTAYCGFDVYVHEVSHYTVTTRTSKTGQRFREVGAGLWNYTYVAPTTGQSVEVHNTGGINQSVTSTASELKYVFLFHGINYRVVTDEGTFVSAGSTAEGVNLRFNADGTVSSLGVFGHAWTRRCSTSTRAWCVWLGAIDTDGDYLPDTQGLRNEREFERILSIRTRTATVTSTATRSAMRRIRRTRRAIRRMHSATLIKTTTSSMMDWKCCSTGPIRAILTQTTMVTSTGTRCTSTSPTR